MHVIKQAGPKELSALLAEVGVEDWIKEDEFEVGGQDGPVTPRAAERDVRSCGRWGGREGWRGGLGKGWVDRDFRRHLKSLERGIESVSELVEQCGVLFLPRTSWAAMPCPLAKEQPATPAPSTLSTSLTSSCTHTNGGTHLQRER